MENLWLAIVIVGQLAFVGWMVHLAVRASQTKRRDRIELHGRLMEQFQSADELSTFMASAVGRRLLEDLAPGKVSAHSRTVMALTVGMILAFSGLGLLVVRAETFDAELATFLGILCLSIGFGFLVSSALGHLLMKRWGVLDRPLGD